MMVNTAPAGMDSFRSRLVEFRTSHIRRSEHFVGAESGLPRALPVALPGEWPNTLDISQTPRPNQSRSFRLNREGAVPPIEDAGRFAQEASTADCVRPPAMGLAFPGLCRLAIGALVIVKQQVKLWQSWQLTSVNRLAACESESFENFFGSLTGQSEDRSAVARASSISLMVMIQLISGRLPGLSRLRELAPACLCRIGIWFLSPFQSVATERPRSGSIRCRTADDACLWSVKHAMQRLNEDTIKGPADGRD
jgi:hypothetical protein